MTKQSPTTTTTAEPVVIKKSTAIHAYSQEKELQILSEQGEWELVLQSEQFQKRSNESQVQLFTQSINVRIDQLRKQIYLFVNKGESGRKAAIGLLERINQLEQVRDNTLLKYYEQFGQQSLSDIAGVVIEF